jgi:hypothetical protein
VGGRHVGKRTEYHFPEVGKLFFRPVSETLKNNYNGGAF